MFKQIDNLLPTPVTIKRESEDEFAPLVIFLKDRRVGRVNSQYHSDIIGLQNGGIPFEAILSVDQGKGALEIRAVESVDSSGLMVSQ
jgi:hypothetical protein